MTKKVAFSAVQPSGELTIGNYLGALRQFPLLQEEYHGYYAAADLHSITVPQKPAELRKRTKEVIAWILASGVDPEKSTVFVQSQVPLHAELTWVLNSITYMGQLSRMTQFKDKSQKSDENLNAALFTYPVLMAADILLYQTDVVPVGEDQRQHIELARDVAIRFNNKYSETFVVPEGKIDKGIGKIMSLKNPDIKMSKSDPDVNAFILLLDDRDTIIRKVKRAVTDSLGEFNYTDEQPGLKNLIQLYSSFDEMKPEEVVAKYKDAQYSVFKEELGELIADKIAPMQERFQEIVADTENLDKICKQGAEKAYYDARKTLTKVYRKVGFYQV